MAVNHRPKSSQNFAEASRTNALFFYYAKAKYSTISPQFMTFYNVIKDPLQNSSHSKTLQYDWQRHESKQIQCRAPYVSRSALEIFPKSSKHKGHSGTIKGNKNTPGKSRPNFVWTHGSTTNIMQKYWAIRIQNCRKTPK